MNIFDIIGPVMIGPSSSHTAGAARLGYVARTILGKEPVKAVIQLSGSFAQTYRGHGTDKALIAGILGFPPDDVRIRDSFDHAAQAGLDCQFVCENIPNAHPNTARITLTSADRETVTVQGASVGGGNILVDELNGMAVHVTGQNNTLVVLHQDKPGAIAAVTNFMAYSGVNIGSFRLARPQKGGTAVMTIEVDGEISNLLIETLSILPNIIHVVLIRAV
ncbi:MAG: L-serine ammonia-lyase, iron-sulfur-dependent, subunit beta [Lawsonibacter sp.]|uniref:L-serine ammonia-lyase, iron-sulfur-dependent subunit beta n=1 Tax=Lawsonibacter sp. JLR.KK007 TaxID=3114293 RepID=UPI00217229BD|nr:L-serine ammonia-lyase, iron-sulfur-dependent, subunit beta [Lawsonibacter sp.]MCI8989354.1 L-serine ammonia-lyase, iron-sulfur-dependent, subunit beta [Lawsonibacter sp.]MCI9268548.1 L-serine ammonia-lyase, iron-sulfur-dependent, subunit beta [Lawsonibacter sp.]